MGFFAGFPPRLLASRLLPGVTLEARRPFPTLGEKETVWHACACMCGLTSDPAVVSSSFHIKSALDCGFSVRIRELFKTGSHESLIHRLDPIFKATLCHFLAHNIGPQNHYIKTLHLF